MYECFHCGERAVTWNGDFDLEDWEPYTEDKGIVHTLTCTNCGAEIVYYCKEEANETNARAEG